MSYGSDYEYPYVDFAELADMVPDTEEEDTLDGDAADYVDYSRLNSENYGDADYMEGGRY